MRNRAVANSALLVGGLTFSALGALAAERVAARNVKVTFVTPPVRPTPDIPTDARRAGTEPDSDAATGSAPGIRFRIVRDLSDHGPLSSIADGRIAALKVTWSDAALLRTDRETEGFLRRLLTISTGSTNTYVPWAQMLGVPSVVAVVEHAEGHSGSLHVWYSWPSIYCVYRDGTGKWWFGHWFRVDALRLET